MTADADPVCTDKKWCSRVSIAIIGYAIGLLLALGGATLYIAIRRGPYFSRFFVEDLWWQISGGMYGIENAIFVSHVIGSVASLLFYLLATRQWRRGNFCISDILVATTLVAAAISIAGWFWAVLGSRKEIAPNVPLLLAVAGGTLLLVSIYCKVRLGRIRKACEPSVATKSPS